MITERSKHLKKIDETGFIERLKGAVSRGRCAEMTAFNSFSGKLKKRRKKKSIP